MVSHSSESVRQVFEGLFRSENSIKNHFYARLRRSIRELDKFIKRYMSSSYSTVDNNFLNKVLQISGHKFSEDTVEEEETIEKANSKCVSIQTSYNFCFGRLNTLNRLIFNSKSSLLKYS